MKDILILSPDQIDDNIIHQVFNLIVLGDQVQKDGLMERIKNAEVIAMKIIDSQLVCVASLKRPTVRYSMKVFKSANFENHIDYSRELGYISTHPDHRRRGYCLEVLNALSPYFSNVSTFATTRKQEIVNLLSRFGFYLVGDKFKSDLVLLVNKQ